MTTRRGADRADRTRGPERRRSPRAPGFLPRESPPARLATGRGRPEAPWAGSRADPRALLVTLKRRVVACVAVTFAAFFGLAAVHVVGVTAHGATGAASPSGAGRTSAAGAPADATSPTALQTLPPGDFFGRPGAPVTGASDSGRLTPTVAPPLAAGGGRPVVTTGGS